MTKFFKKKIIHTAYTLYLHYIRCNYAIKKKTSEVKIKVNKSDALAIQWVANSWNTFCTKESQMVKCVCTYDFVEFYIWMLRTYKLHSAYELKGRFFFVLLLFCKSVRKKRQLKIAIMFLSFWHGAMQIVGLHINFE